MTSERTPGGFAAADLLFQYQRPQSAAGQSVVRTDHASWDAHLFEAGHQSPVSRHSHTDQFWLVVTGGLRFRAEDGAVIGEYGPDEGVVIPRGYAASMECIEGPCEAFRFGAADVPLHSADEDSLIVDSEGDAQTAGPRGRDVAAPTPFGTPRSYKYTAPQITKGKKVDILALTDRGVFGFQVLRAGGETNLHSHPHLDGFWFVRRGAARFYTSDDEVIGELGPNQGVLIPRGFPYWFEAVLDDSNVECELLQMETADVPISGRREDLNNDRVDYAPSKVRSTYS